MPGMRRACSGWPPFRQWNALLHLIFVAQFCVVSSRSLIVCALGTDLLLWDMRGGRPIRRLTHYHGWCSSIACDPHQSTLGSNPTAGVIITGGMHACAAPLDPRKPLFMPPVLQPRPSAKICARD